jgi:hypothetical protein
MTDSADLEPFYGNLRNYVRMVTGGYSNLLMLDAKGGLGKTHNVLEVLEDECEPSDWYHQKGFTTPIELFKTLWQAREEGSVLFLDDMSGVTNNTKAIDMLKAATETQGEVNVVQYRTSQDIEHPTVTGAVLPNTFSFRGRIVMSFNDTPDNRHFDALKDRGTYYNLSFDYQERLELISEVAKLPDFSPLTVSEQKETAEWVKSVTNASFDVTIRSFEEVCNMRHFSNENDANWEKMALEIFDLDYRKHRIIQLREDTELSVEQQVEAWTDETGYSRSTYYDLLDEIRHERGDRL